MKRTIAIVLITAVLLLAFPVTLLVCGFALPPQYAQTYYGELAAMVQRLRTAEGKKIVLIGSSSIAFGVNVDLLESSLPGYTVCPFGLYGAIGTKAMLDLSAPYVGEGDVVVIAPELSSQLLSLYFSAQDMWMAADADFSLLADIAPENRAAMVGNFADYAADKFGYFSSGEPPRPSGAYARASFGENCGMTYARPYNVMPGLCDASNPVRFDSALIGEGFLDYLDSYDSRAYAQGAAVGYNFCPMNALATDTAGMEEFYAFLNDSLSFPILGAPQDYIFDAEWFYDSNFHMNTAGSVVYTAQLVRDLKLAVGDTSPTDIELPAKPQAPEWPTEGEAEDAACFTYAETATGVTVTGLTEQGRGRASLTIPSVYGGRPVQSFAAEVFQGNAALRELTVPATVTAIYGYSFRGCTSLERIVMQAEEPNCAVDGNLLAGADGASVVVADRDAYLRYVVNYYWAQHASRLTYPGAG